MLSLKALPWDLQHSHDLELLVFIDIGTALHVHVHSLCVTPQYYSVPAIKDVGSRSSLVSLYWDTQHDGSILLPSLPK